MDLKCHPSPKPDSIFLVCNYVFTLGENKIIDLLYLCEF